MTTEIFVFICKTDYSKPVEQEVNGTVILPPLVFPDQVLLILQTLFTFFNKTSNLNEDRTEPFPSVSVPN